MQYVIETLFQLREVVKEFEGKVVMKLKKPKKKETNMLSQNLLKANIEPQVISN